MRGRRPRVGRGGAGSRTRRGRDRGGRGGAAADPCGGARGARWPCGARRRRWQGGALREGGGAVRTGRDRRRGRSGCTPGSFGIVAVSRHHCQQPFRAAIFPGQVCPCSARFCGPFPATNLSARQIARAHPTLTDPLRPGAPPAACRLRIPRGVGLRGRGTGIRLLQGLPEGQALREYLHRPEQDLPRGPGLRMRRRMIVVRNPRLRHDWEWGEMCISMHGDCRGRARRWVRA